MSNEKNDALAKRIYAALGQIQDPDLNQDIVSLGFIKNLILKKSLLGQYKVSFEIELTTPACPVKDEFRKQAHQLVSAIDEISEVQVKMTARVRNAQGQKTIPGVKNIIAVGAGKGGVGKSTVAIHLAYALKNTGAKVALLDADIYGPSFAQMLNLTQSPKVKDGKILPIEAYGIPVMTFAFFAPVGEAVIWRGPQIAKAAQQMMQDVHWGEEIDYLIVDLPPGTGDVHLSVAHSASISGAVLVSTPQDVSLIDTMRAYYMFEKLKIPVLGLIENMSGFACPHCDEITPIFGSGGAEKKAQEKKIPFLGKIPLYAELAKASDSGQPLVDFNNEHPVTKIYLDIAGRVAQEMSKEALC